MPIFTPCMSTRGAANSAVLICRLGKGRVPAAQCCEGFARRKQSSACRPWISTVLFGQHRSASIVSKKLRGFGVTVVGGTLQIGLRLHEIRG